MNNDFDKAVNRRDSDSVKWNRYPKDVLPLWVADMDFRSPPPVISAVQERLDHGLFGYSYPQESTKLAICQWLERRFNWIVSPEEVLLFPGVVPAFNIAARACTNPGDSVLIQTPAYHPFLDIPSNIKSQSSLNSLQINQDGVYGIDLDEFNQDLLPTTRIYMLCNPQNPTGRVFRKDELRAMAELCLAKNVIICSDEIHSDIVYSPHRHTPIASISEEISHSTITLISPSKTFNLAGLKASAVIISNPHLRDAFLSHAQGFSGSVNVLGEAAMTAAYSHCDKWLEELLVYLSKNRQLLFDYINNELPDVSMILPEGTYLGWLDFRNTPLESPADFILQEARVALNPGEWFGADYPKFARINFGCQSSVLKTALDRLKSALVST